MTDKRGTCTIPDDLVAAFKKFKMSNGQNDALIIKINKQQLVVELEESLTNCTCDEIAEALPESAPRFIVYSYKYKQADGRVSYPLCFIYYSPQAVNSTLNMLYASSKNVLVNKLEVMKIFDIASPSELTEEWLLSKLAFFK